MKEGITAFLKANLMKRYLWPSMILFRGWILGVPSSRKPILLALKANSFEIIIVKLHLGHLEDHSLILVKNGVLFLIMLLFSAPA